ncbi:hemin uptake protein hemP [Salmonella enterica]|nr:hemin uptake protein hemP [Salmonella enterica]
MSRMDNTELPHPKEIDNETLLPAAERRVNSQALLGPDGKVIIDHNGQ